MKLLFERGGPNAHSKPPPKDVYFGKDCAQCAFGDNYAYKLWRRLLDFGCEGIVFSKTTGLFHYMVNQS